MLSVSADSSLVDDFLCVSEFLFVSPSPFSEVFCEILAAELASRTVSHLFLPDVMGSSVVEDLKTEKGIFPCYLSEAEDTVFHFLFH